MTKPIIAGKDAKKTKASPWKAEGIPRQGSLDQFPGDGGGAIRAGGKGGAFRHDGRRVCAVAGHARHRARQEGGGEPGELFGERTRAVLHELRKQGVNLNQIAHHCNRHQLPPPPEVSGLAATIMALWRKLMP